MNRIAKTLKALSVILRNPWKLNLVINDNEEWHRYLIRKYGITALPVIPLPFFIGDSATIEPFSFLDGGSDVTDMALLKQIAAKIPDCVYFEIGTWRGESVANVASEASICYTLDLPRKELKNFSDNKGFLDSHGIFSQKLDNVRQLYGNSKDFNFRELDIKADLIFIDGDHHYESIVNDTKKVLEDLCHDNSIIVWHDYAYNPELIRYETLAAIMDACPAHLHRHIYHVGNTMCAILYRNETEKGPFIKYGIPKFVYRVNIHADPFTSGKNSGK